MISLYDVLKANKGLPVGEPIACHWGRKLSGGYTIVTYTGILPAVLTGTKAGYLHRYKIYGNTEQIGTPTPENPIVPEGVGERTKNLFDYSAITTGYRIQWTSGATYADATAIMSGYIPVTEGDYTLSMGVIIIGYTSDKLYVGTYRPEDPWKKRSSDVVSAFTVLSSSGVKFVKLMTYAVYEPITNNLMFNLGSTALPYEPYGYKLPLTSAGQDVDIYLGESQTTRQIRKLVLTGKENWGKNDTAISGATIFTRTINDGLTGYAPFCTHYAGSNSITWSSIPTNFVTVSVVSGGVQRLAINVGAAYSEIIDFKSYLAAQYAAGTPVTVWYVLAEPETAAVNEPLMKIGDYADTIDSTQTTAQIPTSAGETTISWAGEGLAPSEVEFEYEK